MLQKFLAAADPVNTGAAERIETFDWAFKENDNALPVLSLAVPFQNPELPQVGIAGA